MRQCASSLIRKNIFASSEMVSVALGLAWSSTHWLVFAFGDTTRGVSCKNLSMKSMVFTLSPKRGAWSQVETCASKGAAVQTLPAPYPLRRRVVLIACSHSPADEAVQMYPTQREAAWVSKPTAAIAAYQPAPASAAIVQEEYRICRRDMPSTLSQVSHCAVSQLVLRRANVLSHDLSKT